MDHLIRVAKGDTVYALIFHGRMPIDGIKFVGEPTDEMQVGLMERPKGYAVKPHAHPPVERVIHGTSEFLYVQEGKVEIEVFDEDWQSLGVHVLNANDFLVFFRGGHRLTMLENARLIEAKQGPYPGEGKAKVFRE